MILIYFVSGKSIPFIWEVDLVFRCFSLQLIINSGSNNEKKTGNGKKKNLQYVMHDGFG